ncbi:hypothetical protein CL616_00895 [archaeon]|nr:hypothetical protein [archaeon]|tara:strand:+ start:1358 stop:1543 length:186 start_codon:yes stop_codon:yes gene_type:complete
MASIENQILFISYITLAAVIAMIYSMRRIYRLESKIMRVEKALLGRIKKKTIKKKVKRKRK